MSRATGKDRPQEDHYRLVEAARAGDAERVAALLEQHILDTKKELLASARDTQPGEAVRAVPIAML